MPAHACLRAFHPFMNRSFIHPRRPEHCTRFVHSSPTESCNPRHPRMFCAPAPCMCQADQARQALAAGDVQLDPRAGSIGFLIRNCAKPAETTRHANRFLFFRSFSLSLSLALSWSSISVSLLESTCLSVSLLCL